MRNDHDFRWRRSSTERRAVAILIAAGLAMATIGYDLATKGRTSHGGTVARGIAKSYDRSRTLDPADAEDGDLSADEADAGAMWARSHRPASVGGWPSVSNA